MALIVPSIRLGYHKLIDRDAVLLIKLALPTTGMTEVQAAPTRFKRLDKDDGDVGYLIGVRILHMTEDERRLFLRKIIAHNSR